MASLDNPFFYNSVNGDRVYDADSFEYLLKKFFTTGVFTGDCAVSATSGMGVQMAAGYCNIDGKVKFYANPVSLSLTTANPTYDRIDTVVIERNDTDRAFHVKAVTGSASATSAATAPVRSAGLYQIVLAEIYVTAGAVSITQANITDKRPDSSVCGLVCSAAQTPDFSDLYAQFTDMFEVWFDRMKGQLSTDAAGNLQNQIDALSGSLGKVEDISGKITRTVFWPHSVQGSFVYRYAYKYGPFVKIGININATNMDIPAANTEFGAEIYFSDPDLVPAFGTYNVSTLKRENIAQAVINRDSADNNYAFLDIKTAKAITDYKVFHFDLTYICKGAVA